MSLKERLIEETTRALSGEISAKLVAAAVAALSAVSTAAAHIAQVHLVEPIKLYPKTFVFIAIVSGVAGIVVGMKIKSNLASKAKPEPKPSDPDREFREMFREHPIWIKTLLKAAHQKGEIYCRTDDWCWLDPGTREYLRCFLDPENISRDRTVLREKNDLSRLFESHSELFDCVAGEDIRSHRLADPNKRQVLSGSSREPLLWWWYSGR